MAFDPDAYLASKTASAKPAFDPDAYLASKSEEPKSLRGFGKNLLEDAAANVQGAIGMASQIEPTMALLRGENPFSTKRPIALAKGLVEGIKQIPAQLAKTVTSPIESSYERPISTALDLATLGGGAAKLANAARPIAKKSALKALPATFKATAGIPEKATEIAINKPRVLRQAPVPDEAINRVVGEPVISAIQQAKIKISDRFGKIYRRYAGMEGPMQEIIDTPIAQKMSPITSEIEVAQKLKQVDVPKDIIQGRASDKKFVPGEMITEKRVTGFRPGEEITVPRQGHNFDQLLVNRDRINRAFVKGDTDALNTLYREYVGTPKSDLNALTMTPKDKLQILTRIKREIQSETNFNKDPMTLRPIDTAKDAALKTLGKEIDDIRLKSKLPGSDLLGRLDDAWKSINDIYGTLQRNLSDPGKSRDTMMKLMKGDNTWATSGKMANQIGKIKEVELLTGQKILQPAMEELTRQVFKDWAGKGFVSQFIRGGSLLGLGAAAVTNPLTALGLVPGVAASSPRLLRGALLKSNALGRAARNAAHKTKTPMRIGLASAFTEKDERR